MTATKEGGMQENRINMLWVDVCFAQQSFVEIARLILPARIGRRPR
jgi:hypothetical protein